MKCAWVKEKYLEVGDHALFIGEVVEAGWYDGHTGGDEESSGRRLVYLDGRYRTVGDVVD